MNNNVQIVSDTDNSLAIFRARCEIQKKVYQNRSFLTAIESMLLQTQELIHQTPVNMEKIQQLTNAMQEMAAMAQVVGEDIAETFINMDRE